MFDKKLRTIKWLINKAIPRKKTVIYNVLDYKMHLDLVHEGISRNLAVYGIREKVHTNLIRSILKQGMIVLDIGANIGYYPLMEASIVGRNGKVFAVEPDPRIIDILKKNIKLNKFDKIIKYYHMAMSDQNGKEEMYLSKKTNLNTFVKSSKDKKSLADRLIDKKIQMKVMTVDSFLQNEGVIPDLIRMDIEGYEVEVISGMRETIKKIHSGFKILFELHPEAYSKGNSLAEQLKTLFHYNFEAKILISAGIAIPQKYKEYGYTPKQIIQTDSFERGWFENIKKEHVIDLVCGIPKITRYLLLEKI